MVKFAFAPIALVAFLAGTALAQDNDSESVRPETTAASSSSATQAPSSSAAQPTAAPSSSASNGGSGASSGVCDPLAGSKLLGDCPYSSTSVPPYDLSSLVSYLIGGYTRGPEAVEPDQVADDLAGSVVKYYPTVTASRSAIKESFLEAISASITAAREDPSRVADGASTMIPASLVNFAVAAAAVAAAGAFVL